MTPCFGTCPIWEAAVKVMQAKEAQALRAGKANVSKEQLGYTRPARWLG